MLRVKVAFSEAQWTFLHLRLTVNSERRKETDPISVSAQHHTLHSKVNG